VPNITINIDVYCARCGAGLCNQTTFNEGRGGFYSKDSSFSVEPCQKCLDEARQEGYDEGYTRAQKDIEE